MKKILLLWLMLTLFWFTFASEAFPAFPMTIYWNTNLDWWTIKVYDWSNNEISSYEITSAGSYGSANAFVLPLSLNSFNWSISFKAIYNWQEYQLESIDDSNRWEWCPSKNSITFVSENCRYDLTFQWQRTNTSWVRLKKDNCPNWDKSDSYYDWTCEWSSQNSVNGRNSHNSTSEWNPKEIMSNWYTREMNDAYEFAYQNGITTKKSISQANMSWPLTRIAMAKMLSQYSVNVLWKIPDPDHLRNCTFTDVTHYMDIAYDNWVTLACQLWIMWVWIKNFRPNETVTRAQFWTALSRMLFGLSDWSYKYYSTHLAKLMQEWIITNDNPALKETRWYVMLMLMRSSD